MIGKYWFLSSVIVCFWLASCSSGKKQAAKSTPMETAERPSVNPPQKVMERVVASIDSRFIDKDSLTTKVVLVVQALVGKDFQTPEEFVNGYNLSYVIYMDYGSRERLGYGNVDLKEAVKGKRANGDIELQFDVKKPKQRASGLMLMEIAEKGTMKKVLNDLPIRFISSQLSDRVAIYDGNGKEVLQRSYVNEGTPFQLKDLNGAKSPLYVRYYDHEFEPASSPMSTNPRSSQSRVLKVDSVFTTRTNEPITLTRTGLYYFTDDTLKTEGMGILVMGDRFPRFTRPEQLARPLMYMSTNQEIKDLQSPADFKKAIDKYWLTLMAGNPDLARFTIANFYSRVEEANRLFTTFKEGWKTDKGMIFIILGNPDKVQRGKDREVWVYNQRANANNINFTFNRRANQFNSNHYELVRYQEYQPIWYPLVESWRTGAIR